MARARVRGPLARLLLVLAAVCACVACGAVERARGPHGGEDHAERGDAAAAPGAFVHEDTRDHDAAHGRRTWAHRRHAHTTVHLIPHSHCDAGWWKTFEEYYELEVRSILDTVVAELLKAPHRRFNWADIAFFERWWGEQGVEQRVAVRGLVQAGRLEFCGGWVMPDEAITDLDAQVRNLATGHAFLLREFGVTPRASWQIDAFGHSAATAQMHMDAGVEMAVLNRVPNREKEARADTRTLQFVWEDTHTGRQLFTHVLDNYYCDLYDTLWEPKYHEAPPVTDDNVNEQAALLALRMLTRTAAFATDEVLLPWGCDFAFVDAEANFVNMDRLMAHINAREDIPLTIRYNTLGGYLDAMRARSDVTWPRLRTSTEFHPYQRGHADCYPGDSSTPYTMCYSRGALRAWVAIGWLCTGIALWMLWRYKHVYEAAGCTVLCAGAVVVAVAIALTVSALDEPPGTPDMWSGFYTSYPAIKHASRDATRAVRAAELIHVLAGHAGVCAQLGGLSSGALMGVLERARRNASMVLHHDSTPGTSTDVVMRDFLHRAAASRELSNAVTGAVVSAWMAQHGGAAAGAAFRVVGGGTVESDLRAGDASAMVLFNALAWRTVHLFCAPGVRDVSVPAAVLVLADTTVGDGRCLLVQLPALSLTSFGVTWNPPDDTPADVPPDADTRAPADMPLDDTHPSATMTMTMAMRMPGDMRVDAIHVPVPSQAFELSLTPARDGSACALHVAHGDVSFDAVVQVVAYHEDDDGDTYTFSPEAQAAPFASLSSQTRDGNADIVYVTQQWTNSVWVVWQVLHTCARDDDAQVDMDCVHVLVHVHVDAAALPKDTDVALRIAPTHAHEQRGDECTLYTDNGVDMMQREGTWACAARPASCFHPVQTRTALACGPATLHVLHKQAGGVGWLPDVAGGVVDVVVHRRVSTHKYDDQSKTTLTVQLAVAPSHAPQHARAAHMATALNNAPLTLAAALATAPSNAPVSLAPGPLTALGDDVHLLAAYAHPFRAAQSVWRFQFFTRTASATVDGAALLHAALGAESTANTHSNLSSASTPHERWRVDGGVYAHADAGAHAHAVWQTVLVESRTPPCSA